MKTINGYDVIATQQEINYALSKLGEEFTKEELESKIEEFRNPPKTQEQIVVEAKQAKELALASITVTTQSGKVFDGRDIDQQRMVSAIISADTVASTETYWKLADNSVELITLNELKEALALSIQALGVIITTEVAV